MAWYVYVAHFFAGAFLMNTVPHLVNGLSGRRFTSAVRLASRGWANLRRS
jgi:hypothetical protein